MSHHYYNGGNDVIDSAELRSEAMRLVDNLDQTEVKVLACLVEGMSRKDIASCFGLSLDEVEHTFQSTIRKLQAERIAEAVRIGICAGLNKPGSAAS